MNGTDERVILLLACVVGVALVTSWDVRTIMEDVRAIRARIAPNLYVTDATDVTDD